MSLLLLGGLFYAINNVLWSIFAKRIDTLFLISNRAVFSTLFIGVIYLMFWDSNSYIRLEEFILELSLLSFVGYLGLLFLVQGFKHGSLIQFCIYSLLSSFIIGALSSYLQIVSLQELSLGIFLILIGYLVYVYSQYKTEEKSKVPFKSHLYFILAHSLFIILIFGQWNYLQQVTTIEMALIQEIVVLIVSSLMLLFRKRKNHDNVNLEWYTYALLSIPISLAQLSNLEGLKTTNPFMEKLVGLTIPALTLVVGFLFKKEKINITALFAFAIMLIGLFLLEL